MWVESGIRWALAAESSTARAGQEKSIADKSLPSAQPAPHAAPD
jgi:hypothetical protein